MNGVWVQNRHTHKDTNLQEGNLTVSSISLDWNQKETLRNGQKPLTFSFRKSSNLVHKSWKMIQVFMFQSLENRCLCNTYFAYLISRILLIFWFKAWRKGRCTRWECRPPLWTEPDQRRSGSQRKPSRTTWTVRKLRNKHDTLLWLWDFLPCCFLSVDSLCGRLKCLSCDRVALLLTDQTSGFINTERAAALFTGGVC